MDELKELLKKSVKMRNGLHRGVYAHLVFPDFKSYFLFSSEYAGQLSDGYYENDRYWDSQDRWEEITLANAYVNLEGKYGGKLSWDITRVPFGDKFIKEMLSIEEIRNRMTFYIWIGKLVDERVLGLEEAFRILRLMRGLAANILTKKIERNKEIVYKPEDFIEVKERLREEYGSNPFIEDEVWNVRVVYNELNKVDAYKVSLEWKEWRETLKMPYNVIKKAIEMSR